MKKTNVLDILFVALMFLFFVSFPFDLWIKSSFYLYLAETLARLIFVFIEVQKELFSFSYFSFAVIVNVYRLE